MPTAVVTAFLRHRDDVLLLRRSDEVGTYRGRWGGVSGHVEPREGGTRDPLEAARAEIDEETGLADACELARRGEPFLLEDEALGRTWRVHPFLFDCGSREVEPNYEAAETAWVPPTEILRRETVPALWTSYDHVRPTVGTVRADDEHGSAYVSLRALDVLRDRAGELAVAGDLAAGSRDDDATGSGDDADDDGDADGDDTDAGDDCSDADGDGNPSGDGDAGDGGKDGADGARGAGDAGGAWDELAALAGELLEARPGMAALRNRVNRAMAEVDERTAGGVEASAQATIERALAADDGAAAVAADRVAGGRVLTLSRSGTVLEALRRADPAGVVVAESRPAREGVGVAEALAAEGLDVTLVADAAVACHLAAEGADAVLVGADTVLPDGSVVNKAGTRAAALAAAREGVPLYAVAARDKISPRDEFHGEAGDPADLYDGEADLRVAVPTFDVTPPDLVDAVLTEDGALAPTEVADVAAEHRALAAWR